MTIGERIKLLRMQMNFSQVKFADMINVSKQTLYKYENNIIANIPSDKIELVAKYCNTTPAYIMGWDEAACDRTMNHFSLILKKLRSEIGLTQDELAAKLNLSRSRVGMYESGKREPNFETLELFANFFTVDMDYFLGRSSVRQKYQLVKTKKENTSTRLKYLMQKRNIRQIDILNLCKPLCEEYGIKMNKSDLSQYVSGKSEPGQDKLYILCCALNVSEAWLMGYDVPTDRLMALSYESSYSDRLKKLNLTPDEWEQVIQYAEFIKQKSKLDIPSTKSS